MKHTIPSTVWETKKAQIAKLYKDEEWPLKQVIKQMRSADFNPSETQLRSKLKKWRVTKPSRQTRKKPPPLPLPQHQHQHQARTRRGSVDDGCGLLEREESPEESPEGEEDTPTSSIQLASPFTEPETSSMAEKGVQQHQTTLLPNTTSVTEPALDTSSSSWMPASLLGAQDSATTSPQPYSLGYDPNPMPAAVGCWGLGQWYTAASDLGTSQVCQNQSQLQSGNGLYTSPPLSPSVTGSPPDLGAQTMYYSTCLQCPQDTAEFCDGWSPWHIPRWTMSQPLGSGSVPR
ncbi:hypothetical protein PHISP_06867 [Aspergillus sp. HF37]|nr:hypothetical protein PHISP_06867 [Aspergillus sp. HF37]